MKTIKQISLAMSIALSMGVASVVQADDKGDSLIMFPADGASISETSTDVWFVKDNTAKAYSLTLVNVGDAGTDLDPASCHAGMAAALADDTKVLKSEIIMADTLSCDDESQVTLATVAGLTIDIEDVTTEDTPIRVCKWTTDLLPPANYAIAINPIHVGDDIGSRPETIAATLRCDDDSAAHNSNDAESVVTAQAAGNRNFQKFTIEAAATVSSGITQAPDSPVVTGPVGDVDNDANLELTFNDVSPTEGQGTWYKVYIEAPDASRVTIGGDNWFKLLVDSELVCEADVPTATGVSRPCTITIPNADLPTMADGDYKWWVRGYNGDAGGATGPWSTPAGVFSIVTP